MKSEYDVLIIGAGQTGLALGKALTDAGLPFVILEAQKEVAAHWRAHYDSLVLFTPRRYSSLPGLRMEGNPEEFPTKDEYAGYLVRYAKQFALPVVCGAKVTKLSRTDERFSAKVGRKSYEGRQVVVAVGNTVPVVPHSDGTVFSIHSSAYKNPAQLPGGKVLVVGGGNSAAQIAVELAKTRSVDLSLLERPRFISSHYFGKNVYFWSELLCIHRLPSDTWLGKLFARKADYIIGFDLLSLLYSGTIRRKAPVLRIRNGKVVFGNGAEESYDAVIFATGFRPEYAFLDVPGAMHENGVPKHVRGVSPVPGLYFIGLRNQISNVSGNIFGTHVNTPHILNHILLMR